MAVVKSVKVKTETKSLNTLKIEDAPVVEATIAGDEMVEKTNLRYSSGALPAGVESKIKASTQFIVGYIPTIFGGRNCKRLVSAISDFYNKVTGSALQTTHISDGDLFQFFKVGYEWRVLLAVIRKMIRQYNMISSTNDAYGRKHFDSVFGLGSYSVMSANYNDIVKDTISLTELVNQRFPMPKGNNALQFEIDLISETYVDDPNGKGSLIDFKRIFKDTVHDSMGFTTYAGSPREVSHGWNFWIGLDRNGQSVIYTVPVNFSQVGWTGILKTIVDTSIEETWYKDIMPYVTHMLDCGMVSDQAPLPEANTSGEWSPVYNPNVLAFIRNAKYCGELANELSGGNFNIFEHTNGYVYEGRAKIEYGTSSFATYAGLHVLPLYADGIVVGSVLHRPTKFVGIRDNNPENFLFNLEDYPSDKDTIKNVISGQYLVSEDGFELLEGTEAGSNGKQIFPIISECTNVVLSNIYSIYLNVNGAVMYRKEIPTAMYLAVDDAASNVFTRSDCKLFKRTDAFSDLTVMLTSHMYNFIPNIRLYACSNIITSESTLSLEQYVSSNFIAHDVDSLVYFPIERLKIIFKELAYHAWYDSEEVKVKSFK